MIELMCIVLGIFIGYLIGYNHCAQTDMEIMNQCKTILEWEILNERERKLEALDDQNRVDETGE